MKDEIYPSPSAHVSLCWTWAERCFQHDPHQGRQTKRSVTLQSVSLRGAGREMFRCAQHDKGFVTLQRVSLLDAGREMFRCAQRDKLPHGIGHRSCLS